MDDIDHEYDDSDPETWTCDQYPTCSFQDAPRPAKRCECEDPDFRYCPGCNRCESCGQHRDFTQRTRFTD